jgi:hypothetical protein
MFEMFEMFESHDLKWWRKTRDLGSPEVTWMNDPRLAQMCGAEDADASKRLSIKCWSSIFHRIASECFPLLEACCSDRRTKSPCSSRAPGRWLGDPLVLGRPVFQGWSIIIYFEVPSCWYELWLCWVLVVFYLTSSTGFRILQALFRGSSFILTIPRPTISLFGMKDTQFFQMQWSGYCGEQDVTSRPHVMGIYGWNI